MSGKIVLRDMMEGDIKDIPVVLCSQDWSKPEWLYPKYFGEQQAGKRDVVIALLDGDIAGYLTIIWQTEYSAFREKGIPEISDLLVMPSYRRKGIATKLMDEAERRISQRSKYAGLGVGLCRDYGKAQIMYANRGYVPDGRGVCYKNKELDPGLDVKLDDDLCLMLVKELN